MQWRSCMDHFVCWLHNMYCGKCVPSLSLKLACVLLKLPSKGHLVIPVAPVLSTNVVSLHALSLYAWSWGDLSSFKLWIERCISRLAAPYRILSPWVSGRRGASSVHHLVSLATGLQGTPECMGLSFCFLASALTRACSHDQLNQLWFPLVIRGGISVGPQSLRMCSSLIGLVIVQDYRGSRRS